MGGFRSLTRIPGGLDHRRLVTVKGFVPQNSDRFTVNLQGGDSLVQDAEIALHISVRFDESPDAFVRNSKIGGSWGDEERDGLFPFRRGQAFELQIHCGHHGYQIAVNGHHVATYDHRIGHDQIDHVSIFGKVEAVAVYFSNEPLPGHSGPSYNPIDYEPHDHCHHVPVAQLVNVGYPDIPSVERIPGGVRPGRLFRICATPFDDIETLIINFQHGDGVPSDTVPLHISIRFSASPRVVVRNTKTDGAWGPEERDGSFPFEELKHFEALILVERDEFKIAINGKHFTSYNHRLPCDLIDHVRLSSEGGACCSLLQFDYVNPHHYANWMD